MAGVLDLGTLLVRITADATVLQSVQHKALKSLDDTARQMETIGRRMSVAVTAPLALVARAAGSTIVAFDKQMTRALAIMDDASPQVRKRMEDVARSISDETVHRPQELASAYFQMAQSGLTAGQSMASLRTVANFATGALIDTERATELLIKSQSALGLASQNPMQQQRELSRVANVLTKAANMTTASQESLATSLMTKSAAAARVLGKDVEETVAVLSAFAKVGVQGELAGERLDIVWRDLAKAATENAAIWQRMGLSAFTAQGQFRNTADIIEDLDRALRPLNDQQRLLTLHTLGFQYRSVSAIKQLLGLQDAIRGYEQSLRNVGNESQRLADRNMKSLSSQIENLKAQIASAAIDLQGDFAAALSWVSQKIRELLSWWKSLDAQQKTAAVQWAAIAAATGPVLLLFGSLVRTAMALVSILRVLSPLLLTIPGAFIGAVASIGLLAKAVYDIAGGTANFNKQLAESRRLAGQVDSGIGARGDARLAQINKIADPGARRNAIGAELTRAKREVDGYRASIRGIQSEIFRLSDSWRGAMGLNGWFIDVANADLAETQGHLAAAQKRVTDLQAAMQATDVEAQTLAADMSRVGDDQEQPFADMIEGTEKAQSAIRDLANEIFVMSQVMAGSTEDSAKALLTMQELAEAGAPQELIDEFQRLSAVSQQMQADQDRQQEAQDEAKRLIEETLTPLEIYERQLTKIEELRNAGLISPDVANRAALAAGDAADTALSNQDTTLRGQKLAPAQSELDSFQAQFLKMQAGGNSPAEKTNQHLQKLTEIQQRVLVGQTDQTRELKNLKGPAPRGFG